MMVKKKWTFERLVAKCEAEDVTLSELGHRGGRVTAIVNAQTKKPEPVIRPETQVQMILDLNGEREWHHD